MPEASDCTGGGWSRRLHPRVLRWALTALALVGVLGGGALPTSAWAETPSFGLTLAEPVRMPRASFRVTTLTGFPDLLGLSGGYRFASGLSLEGGLTFLLPALYLSVGYSFWKMAGRRTSLVGTPVVIGQLGIMSGVMAGGAVDFVYWMGAKGKVGFNLQALVAGGIGATSGGGAFAIGGSSLEPVMLFHVAYGVSL